LYVRNDGRACRQCAADRAAIIGANARNEFARVVGHVEQRTYTHGYNSRWTRTVSAEKQAQVERVLRVCRYYVKLELTAPAAPRRGAQAGQYDRNGHTPAEFRRGSLAEFPLGNVSFQMELAQLITGGSMDQLDDVVQQAIERQVLEEAIEELPPKCRYTLLATIDHQSYEEIAKHIKVDMPTVGRLFERALEHLLLKIRNAEANKHTRN